MVDFYLGEVRTFAGNYAPSGWAICNGALLQISGNEALFALLGTRWGGNGVSSFALPDLRGRLAVGCNAIVSMTTALSQRPVGQTGGKEEETLFLANLPAHRHRLFASKLPATSATPDATKLFAAAASPDTSAKPGLPYVVNITGFNVRNLKEDTLSPVGKTIPHTNLMPAMTINYIIALTGLYPVS